MNAPIPGAARIQPSPIGPQCKIWSAKIGRSAVAPPRRTANMSSVIVARITFLLSINRIPSFKLRHAFRSELLPRSLLRIGSTSRKNDIAQIASTK